MEPYGFLVALAPDSPEPMFSGAAVRNDGAGLTLALAGRLHYRAELPAASSDEARIFAAYRANGLAALGKLEGDFALALADRRARRLMVLGDPMGAHALHWRGNGRQLVAGTDLRGVSAEGARDIDPGYIADVLLMPGPDPSTLAAAPYRGVRHLRPGEILACGFDGRNVSVTPRAAWRDRIAGHAARSFGEAAEALRALLTAAVRERRDGTVAAHVSGGMDSSAVALLAARIAPARGLALVYDTIEPLRGERQYIDLIRHPGLGIDRIPADDLLDFDVFDRIGPHAEPLPWLFRLGQDLALLNAAKSAGARTVLTGLGADETLAVGPYEIADLLKRGRLLAGRNLAARWAAAHHCGLAMVLRPFGWEPLALPRSRGLAMRHPRFAPPAWLNPEFVSVVDWPDRARGHAAAFHGTARATVLGQLAANIANAAGDWIGRELARPMGLAPAHPFRDPRVLAAAAAARLANPPAPGVQKPILAEAMRGVVPGAILDRRGKAAFNAVHYRGFARNRDALHALLRDAPVEADAYFDRTKMAAAIDDAAMGYRSLESLHGLGASLAIVKWLSLLPRWRKGETALPR